MDKEIICLRTLKNSHTAQSNANFSKKILDKHEKVWYNIMYLILGNTAQLPLDGFALMEVLQTMSLLKKFAAASAALAMSLSLVSCGKDTSWGAEIDGTRLRAGILIYFQSSALSDAYGYMGENDEDVLAINIEDTPAREWINEKAIESMRKYAAIENKFGELGLSFKNHEDERVKITAEQWWEYLGEYYEELGVSEQSYLDIGINSAKEDAIFDYYYGEGGEKEISKDEITSYLKDTYARIKYIEMPLKDGEENILKSDEKADIKTMAEEYIERAKNGESFEAIAKEYDAYYTSLSASEDEEANDEEYSFTEDEDPGDDEPDYGTVVTKESTLPSASVIEKVFGDMAENSYAYVEEYEVAYIVYKMDLFADEDFYENYQSSVRHELKDEEFDTIVDGWIAEQNVVINNDSIDRYKLDKLTV